MLFTFHFDLELSEGLPKSVKSGFAKESQIQSGSMTDEVNVFYSSQRKNSVEEEIPFA